MNKLKSFSRKDRYGNMFSMEFFEPQDSVPMMVIIPEPDGYNGADTSNHPGEARGTDTVPAMLTPGEFVVNRAATHANLPLLKAINNGAQGYSNGGIAYRSKGGPIQYLSNGTTDGPVQASSTLFTSALDSATSALTNFGTVLQSLKNSFDTNNQTSNSPPSNQQNNGTGVNIDMRGISQFTTKLQNLINQLQSLSQIPSKITLDGKHEVNVNIVGAEALQALGSSFSGLVTRLISNAINKYDTEKTT